MSTHQQLLYHIVFSTKHRRRWLTDGFREDVFAYMAGTCRELGGFALIIGGYVDHVHLLVHIPAKVAVSEFVGKVKSSTSKHINDNSGVLRKFGWQVGFGEFSVSASVKNRVYRYIENQLMHHQGKTFESEYLGLLRKHGVEFDPKYVFD